MIVREILDKPMMSFDFFNDYKDTYIWLSWKRLPHRARIVQRILKRRYEKYLQSLSHRKS
jgi:hypothetical protein